MTLHINIGRWSIGELDSILSDALRIDDPGGRIAYISKQFIDTAYQESTLTGDEHASEELVINLSGMDCFTFLDYVEALRMSASFAEFADTLKRVRYRNGIVTFLARNHFFSDWAANNAEFVEDVTEQIGADRAKRARKVLNLKEDGSPFIKGLGPKTRTITYVPADALDETVLQHLRTGDYAGIYSELQGLDVSHTGIVIRRESSLILRHASSAERIRKVVDQDFMDYIAGKPGLMVLRPIHG